MINIENLGKGIQFYIALNTALNIWTFVIVFYIANNLKNKRRVLK